MLTSDKQLFDNLNGSAKRKNGFGSILRVAVIIFVVVSFSLALAAGILTALAREQKLKAIMAEIAMNAGTNNLSATFDLLKSFSVSPLSGSATTSSVSQAAATRETSTGQVIKSQPRQLAEKTASRPTFGNPEAKLVIVEFADFECTVCQQEYPFIREIMNKHKNDLLFIFRQYPFKTDFSTTLAHISLCANEQGKFWQVHDRLFANQGNISQPQDLNNLLNVSGVDLGKMAQCLNDERYQAIINEDMSDAGKLDLQGTPTFFVNGNKVEGAISVDDWEKIISQYKKLIAD